MTDLVQQIVRTAAAMAAMGQAVTAVRLAVPLAPGAVPLLSLVPKVSACGISPPVAPGVAVRGCERPEDWRMALDPQPLDVLDAQYLEAAWALGAWDVARTEHAPLPVGADPADPDRTRHAAGRHHHPASARWGCAVRNGQRTSRHRRDAQLRQDEGDRPEDGLKLNNKPCAGSKKV